MTNAVFPQTIFMTQRPFDDYGADDMRYGDISADRLIREFGLKNISNIVDPYTLTRLTTFDNPQSRFAGVYGGTHRGGTISIQDCARLLFEEMQKTSLPYSFVGPYRYLINQMLRHFQRSTGTPFGDAQLNAAYSQKLQSDYNAKSVNSIFQKTFGSFIDYENKCFPQERLKDVTSAIGGSILPKFDSMIIDKINGMGITIHDVHATKIDIISLEVYERGWKARVKFSAQDHFGLDINDIRKKKFYQFKFFQIWFVLQRFNKFGFRPFLTNLEAIVNIQGNR
ncbi:DUF3289 family protein [Pseudescherichia sp. L3]|uniref:DUF3289 family protein n=1 Tax=Pseudescherichia sp. L3 TaxID=2970817 RepID=UPI00214FA2FF|nr:DUF3289 family protein [Pseudescherichia sp. L3]MCR4457401.1 DUF3289 family protein [Pseudescherichia sp. L3]